MFKSRCLKTILFVIVFMFSGFAISACSSNEKSSTTSTTTQNTITKNTTHVITFSDSNFNVNVVTKEEDLVRGLSGTKSLDSNSGLLFDFQKSDIYSIWMKDMNYSLDIIWLDKDLKVVYLAENISPETYPKTFQSDSPAQYVLEINAGQAQSSGIEVGDTAQIQQNK